MLNIFKKNERLFGFLIVALAIIGTFRATEAINLRLARLPVVAVPQKKVVIAELNSKGLYPVVVRQSRAPLEGGAETVDQVFREKVEEVEPPPPPPPPDFSAIFRSMITLDGTTPTGAFLNGRYYAIGEQLTSLAITNGGMSMTPRLVRVREGAVDLAYGTSGKLTLKAESEAP